MNKYYMFGMISGIAAALLVAAILLKISRRGRGMKCRFDERQEEARGKAFRYGFFVFLIGDAAYAVLGSSWPGLPADEGAAMMFIIVAAVGVMAVYSIWENAYFSLNERGGFLMVLFALCCILNLVVGIRNAVRDRLFVDGRLTVNIANLLCAALFFVIFVVMAVRHLCDRDSDED